MDAETHGNVSFSLHGSSKFASLQAGRLEQVVDKSTPLKGGSLSFMK
jgi:hypothetical protein